MVFSSIIFLFGFLPLVLLLYFMLDKRLQLLFLLLASLAFYFFGENYLIWIILVSSLVNYLSALLIAGGFSKMKASMLPPGGKRTTWQKTVLFVSVIINLAFLAYFKYFNFFIDSFNNLITNIGLQSLRLTDVISVTLPLGISFYTFQAMSYTIDVYRGHVAASRSFLKIATYITMFPQLVAGPIVRYVQIEKQIDFRRLSGVDFADGVKRFISGLAKKVLIANTMARVADYVFVLEQGELTTGLAWIGIVAYSLQIYFDFSGYSCMAIGMGKMLGFSFPENFNYPYISKSIKEFWRRWHITLSTWFRDYLYISLGGSRKGSLITYRNLLVVFFLCGLWHGASWNFVIWGLFHGIFLVLERIPVRTAGKRIPVFIRHVYVLLVVMLAWVFFRSDNINQSLDYFAALFSFIPDNIYRIREVLQADVIIMFFAGLLFSLPVYPRLMQIAQSLKKKSAWAMEFAELLVLFSLLLLSAMNLADSTYNPFIYFRF